MYVTLYNKNVNKKKQKTKAQKGVKLICTCMKVRYFKLKGDYMKSQPCRTSPQKCLTKCTNSITFHS